MSYYPESFYLIKLIDLLFFKKKPLLKWLLFYLHLLNLFRMIIKRYIIFSSQIKHINYKCFYYLYN